MWEFDDEEWKMIKKIVIITLVISTIIGLICWWLVIFLSQ